MRELAPQTAHARPRISNSACAFRSLASRTVHAHARARTSNSACAVPCTSHLKQRKRISQSRTSSSACELRSLALEQRQQIAQSRLRTAHARDSMTTSNSACAAHVTQTFKQIWRHAHDISMDKRATGLLLGVECPYHAARYLQYQGTGSLRWLRELESC
jgi:hypothetical protein